MCKPNFTYIFPFIITWFIARMSLLSFDEAHGINSPVKTNSSLVNCTRRYAPPQVRHGVDDVVVFENNRTALHRQAVFVECDLVNFGSWTKVEMTNLICDYTDERTFELKELNLRNDTARNPWMSCRFLREWYDGNKKGHSKWVREYTPPLTPTQPFESYLNVSLERTQGNGSFTHVFMNDTGIFVEQQLLALWGEDKGLISTDPGHKYLNSRDGNPCYSMCTKRMLQYVPAWRARCYSGNERDLQLCDPRDDYDIRKYALNGVLSIEGIPCFTQCTWRANSGWRGESGYRCWFRDMDDSLDKPGYSGRCSPSPGLTYRGDNCTGPCTFQYMDYSSCAVEGESEEIPCSV